jgi:hypothetical protein
MPRADIIQGIRMHMIMVLQNSVYETAPNYNEAEIRFHVIDPIIRALGYANSGSTYLFLEEELEYPYYQIGRKSKKDLPIGRADYRAGIKGARGSFVVEAKSGSTPISKSVIEQAHSYAAHAQVGANYFVLCNGHTFQIYETLSGADSIALITINLNELNERFYEIENILSPPNLEKNCKINYDRGLRLSEGIGSSVRIRNGTYRLSQYELQCIVNGEDRTAVLRTTPQISNAFTQLDFLRDSFELKVSDGIVSRDSDGRIFANASFSGVTTHNKYKIRY